MTNQIKSALVGKLQLSYLEAGQGPLILCLHGYPDTAYSWQETTAFLVQLGYRVISPFTRGYYPSDIPQDSDYSVLTLAKDMVQFLDLLGEDDLIVIGHDWGALTGYAMAHLIPNKITKLVTLDMAHPRVLEFSPKTIWKGRHILTYQFKRAAIKHLKRNNFAHVDELYKRWSPNWDFGAEETAVVKEAFSHPGRVEAALGYYWSFMADLTGKDEQAKEARMVSSAKTAVSTLCIVGDWGGISKKQMSKTPDAFTGAYQYVILPDVGHFLHREAPEKFFPLLERYLTSA